MPAGERHRLLRTPQCAGRGRAWPAGQRTLPGRRSGCPHPRWVAFIDPKRSEVDIVQAIGRAIRRDPNKTVGTIVIPVFIDTDEDPDTALDKSAFKPIWDVLLALRAHDEVLGEQLDALRRQLGSLKKGSPLRMPDKIYVNLPDAVSDEFARAFKVRLVKMTSAPWEEWIGALEQYVEDNGHACPLVSYTTSDGLYLGRWVGKQRGKYAKDQLSADRVQQLEKLPGWEWNVLEAAWKENYYAVCDFHAQKGHARPPYSEVLHGLKIGVWASEQRGQYHGDRLSPEHIQLLELLDGWDWNAREGVWDRNLRHLQEFRDQEGHVRVPIVHPLRPWITNQRTHYSTGKLSPERIRRLEAINGWGWTPREDRWEKNFRCLQDYRAQKGHACPKYDEMFSGVKFGLWVQNQRQLKDSLSPERIRRLEAIDGWTWNNQEDAWNQGLRRLQEFRDQEGHALVPTGFETADGYRLFQWVNIQRTKYSKGKQSPERIQRLEAIDGWAWNALDAAWEKHYSCLQEFREREGHARVPSKFETAYGLPLNKWIEKQRMKYRKGELSPERIRRLKAVDGWVWNTRP